MAAARPPRRAHRRRIQPAPAPARLLLAAAALVLATLAAPRPASAAIVPGDKAALLAFKQGLTAEGGDLLSTWVPATDPCLDGWTGVRCSCHDFFAAPQDGNQSQVGRPRWWRGGGGGAAGGLVRSVREGCVRVVHPAAGACSQPHARSAHRPAPPPPPPPLPPRRCARSRPRCPTAGAYCS